MLAWQRRARLAVATCGVAAAVVVFVTTRQREAPPVPQALPRVDRSAMVESTGTFVRQIGREKEHFRIEADRQLTYAGGTTKLAGVKINVERGGRSFVVTGREAEVADGQSDVVVTGDVRMTANDGLTATAERASLSEGEGIVRAPGPVTFARGRLTGQGVGMSYDQNNEILTLTDQATVAFAPDQAGAGGIDVTSGLATFARRDNYLQFERDVHILRDGDLIESDSALVHLTEDGSRITSIELRGNSEVVTGDTLPGALTAMAARDINLIYAEDGAHVANAVLTGAATAGIAGEAQAGERRLSAESLEIGLAPDGVTLTSLSGRERVVLDLPSTVGLSRNVRSTSLTGAGDAANGLTATTFDGNVEFRERGGAPAVQRLVRSRRLVAAMGESFGDIREARFSGGVTLDDGATHGAAADARYDVAVGQVELSGNVGSSTPRVTDDQMVVDATRIDLTLVGPKMKATGAVRSVIHPPKQSAGSSPQRKVPSIMQQDQPINGSSEILVYDGGATSQAVFSGSARVWQADTAVQADTVTLFSQTGNLTAQGDVRSALSLEQVNRTTQARERAPAIATGREMEYDDAQRKATYRGEARVNGPLGDLRARTIELYLADDHPELERTEAYEEVSLRHATRTGTGSRLSYFRADDRYVMLGAPVRTVDVDCRETIGKTLTFFGSTDRILVDGNEETRTQTKNSGDCPGPRPQ